MEQVFSRNLKERQVLSQKHIAIVGVGSGGSAIADMAARAGMGRITLIDPDTLAPENLGRHMLTGTDLGKTKVEAMRARILAINPACQVDALACKFSPYIFEAWVTFAFGPDGCKRNERPPKVDHMPDLVVSCVDSFNCESSINGFCLEHNIPAVYGGAWGAASAGEILCVIPGKSPCYECYAGFRRSEVEIPNDPRKYTDPDFDGTKTGGQPGLWSNMLIITGLQFQVVLGVMGLLDCIDYDCTLWLMNISDCDSPLQPLAVTFAKVKKGCAVCDESKLSELDIGLAREGLSELTVL